MSRSAMLLLAIMLTLPVLTGAAGITSAGDLEGMDIRGPGGERLGQIQSVLIDPRLGRISYLLVAPAGSRDSGLVVPWGAVRLTPDRREIILRIEADQIRHSPFRPQDVGSREGEAAIHQYYGLTPYWEDPPPRDASPPRAPGAPGGLRIVPQ